MTVVALDSAFLDFFKKFGQMGCLTFEVARFNRDDPFDRADSGRVAVGQSDLLNYWHEAMEHRRSQPA